MTRQEFDLLVEAMKHIAWHATGSATHQRRAGNLEEDLEDIASQIEFEEEED